MKNAITMLVHHCITTRTVPLSPRAFNLLQIEQRGEVSHRQLNGGYKF